MHEASESFTWWHRDEIQVLVVYVIVILFFGRSAELEAALLVLGSLPIAGFWLLRFWGRTGKQAEVVRFVIVHLPEHPWDRSRLVMSILSTIIVGALFVHRLVLFQRDAAAGVSPDSSMATPLDLYWVLFLGWYAVVWSVVAIYLCVKWMKHETPMQHKFLEGLVGSMYFYHGLPTKGRVVTFAGGLILGGLPTAYALQLDPMDPAGMQAAALLVIPVATLILMGAWFASRWVGTTPSGEV